MKTKEIDKIKEAVTLLFNHGFINRIERINIIKKATRKIMKEAKNGKHI